jgi:hypothetical protein
MDPVDLNSYRPISNLSFASKFVERSVAARFASHCDQNQLFPVRQSAFRRHHSTETAVLIVHNDIVRATDRGQLTAMMFLDLSSAFDTVDHAHLLSVLRRRFSVEGRHLTGFSAIYQTERKLSLLAIVNPTHASSTAAFHKGLF